MALTSSSSPSPLILLKACKTLKTLEQLHALIIRKGSEQDHVLVSEFISICSSINPTQINYGSAVFDRVIQPNVYVWNTLLKAHCTHSSFTKSFSFFKRMKQCCFVCPDKYTFPSVFKACGGVLAVREGRVVHGLVVKYGAESDVFVGSSLVGFYGKCGEIGDARKVFDEMPVRNEVTWTSMIVGYSSNGDYLEAKKVFDEMPQRNVVSWNAMINGFVKSGDLVSAKKLFDEMPDKNMVSFGTMIDGYAKLGDMLSARALFDQSPDKDVVSWSTLISGYAQNGQPKEAVKLFNDMICKNVKPDEYAMVSLMSACSQAGDWELANRVDSYLSQSAVDLGQTHVTAALVEMHAKCGNLERAATLFEKLPSRDLVSYCSMIQGLSVHGHADRAVDLFHKMLSEGLTPDYVAFTIILSACSHAELVDEGCHFFDIMVNEYSLKPSIDHYACKVSLLGRAGRLNEAYNILKDMPMEPHASAWGALLFACRIHSDVALGEEVASRLFKIEPLNAANYVLLSDIYAASNQWADVNRVRNQMTEMGIRKLRGCSWL